MEDVLTFCRMCCDKLFVSEMIDIVEASNENSLVNKSKYVDSKNIKNGEAYVL